MCCSVIKEIVNSLACSIVLSMHLESWKNTNNLSCRLGSRYIRALPTYCVLSQLIACSPNLLRALPTYCVLSQLIACSPNLSRALPTYCVLSQLIACSPNLACIHNAGSWERGYFYQLIPELKVTDTIVH